MTWGDPPPFIAKQLKKAKAVTPESLAKESEDSQQMALFAWAALNVGKYPALKWLYAIPNGGFRHIAEAAKFVATGTRAGVPDICLPYASPMVWMKSSKYHGCYIELKKAKRRIEKNGGCSQEQLDYLAYLTGAGYYCKVCYSWEEARDCLVNYLEGRL